MITLYGIRAADHDFTEVKYEKFISRERFERAERLKSEADRKLCLGAEYVLNQAVLREYPNIKTPVEYTRGDHGKPYLTNASDIFFNVSHAGNYAVCAIGDTEVGIDIERVRPVPERVLRKFTEAERAYLNEAEGMEREKRFAALWVMKESFVKAVGRGLTLPLDSFQVLPEPEPCVRQQEYEGDFQFRLFDLPGSQEDENFYKIAICARNAEISTKIIWLDK